MVDITDNTEENSMNKQRRKRIEAVLNELEDLRSRIEEIHGEEQDAFDALPEGLQQSERGVAAEEAVSYLGDALTGFDEIYSALNEALEK